jgi:hypothetical protein
MQSPKPRLQWVSRFPLIRNQDEDLSPFPPRSPGPGPGPGAGQLLQRGRPDQAFRCHGRFIECSDGWLCGPVSGRCVGGEGRRGVGVVRSPPNCNLGQPLPPPSYAPHRSRGQHASFQRCWNPRHLGCSPAAQRPVRARCVCGVRALPCCCWCCLAVWCWWVGTRGALGPLSVAAWAGMPVQLIM